MTEDELLAQGEDLMARMDRRERERQERCKSVGCVNWVDEKGVHRSRIIPRLALIEALQR